MSKQLHISADLSLPLDAVTRTFVVYGGKGKGKTNFGSVLCEELAKNRLRFCVTDPLDVWWGLQHGSSKEKSGIDVVILGGKHGDIPIEPAAGTVIADFVADETVSTVIVMRRANGEMWTNGERIKFMRDFIRRLFVRQGEQRIPLMLVIDEAGRFVPQMAPKGSLDITDCIGAIEETVEWGRNVGIGVCLITQRSARMNKSVSELAECMIAFQTAGPNSISAIVDWFGEHIDRKRQNELIEALRKLPVGRALIVSPEWLEFESEAQIRLRETFDSSATPKAGGNLRAPGAARKPDLEKYQIRMAETIEKAKASDPKELQKKTRELNDKLTKLSLELERERARNAAPAKSVEGRESQQALKRLQAQVSSLTKGLQEAMKFIVNINAKDFFAAGSGQALDEAAITKALTSSVGQITKLIEAKLDARNREVDLARREGQRAISRLQKLITDEPIEVDVTVKHNDPFTVSTAAPEKLAPRPRIEVGSNGHNSSLPKGEARILTALIQYPNGLGRSQITALTGFARSTRDRYLQFLAAKGLATSSGSNLVATDAGIAALPGAEPLPTGVALQNYWLSKLPSGEAAILKVLMEAYPSEVDREAVSTATGLARSTRDRYAQFLAAKELIESSRGALKASDNLFLE